MISRILLGTCGPKVGEVHSTSRIEWKFLSFPATGEWFLKVIIQEYIDWNILFQLGILNYDRSTRLENGTFRTYFWWCFFLPMKLLGMVENPTLPQYLHKMLEFSAHDPITPKGSSSLRKHNSMSCLLALRQGAIGCSEFGGQWCFGHTTRWATCLSCALEATIWNMWSHCFWLVVSSGTSQSS